MEIHHVTSQCCDDAKALLANDYSLCVIIMYRQVHGEMTTFPLAQKRHNSRCSFFFISRVKPVSNSIK